MSWLTGAFDFYYGMILISATPKHVISKPKLSQLQQKDARVQESPCGGKRPQVYPVKNAPFQIESQRHCVTDFSQFESYAKTGTELSKV